AIRDHIEKPARNCSGWKTHQDAGTTISCNTDTPLEREK
ncbi:MAG: hypothetical protein ACI9W2_005188, partial [Gammaproteobacteria bacterium]